MVAVTAVPTDGRLTSLTVLNLALTGGEVMYIVSPGNAALGNSFQVTTATLGAYFQSYASVNVALITSGATSITPYPITTTNTGVLFDKTVGAASYAVAPLSSSMIYRGPFLVKDFKGDAGTHPIQITFTGGETCDGKAIWTINSPYGFFSMAPSPTGANWYQTG